MSLVDVSSGFQANLRLQARLTRRPQPYHAYIFGTSFWYALRGMARLTDPVRVSGWFRPPAQPVLTPSGTHP